MVQNRRASLIDALQKFLISSAFSSSDQSPSFGILRMVTLSFLSNQPDLLIEVRAMAYSAEHLVSIF